MVTIRNDIEANGNANRATDSAASVVDGTKNVNHLANGSRRSTMADIKQKSFNRKCVALLALVVCVCVCFGVGMLFLYGHLEDRLSESASHGSMLHDKNGNPVKPLITTTSTTTTTTVAATTTSTTAATTTSTIATTTTDEPIVTSQPPTEPSTTNQPSTSEESTKLPATVRPRGGIFFDSWIPTSTQGSVGDTKDKGSRKSSAPQTISSDEDYASPGRHDEYADEDDDDSTSGSGSGNNQ